mgnify:CR=1 FL=1
MHPCTPLAPPSIILTPSHLPRARILPLRREGCGMHHALPSSPRRSTPLRPQVVILDFLDTFSSRSRRWCHHFWLYFPFLRSDSWRAVCVVGGTGEGVACRRARCLHICVDGDVISFICYTIERISLLSTLPDTNGRVTRPRASTALIRQRRKKGTQHSHSDTRPRYWVASATIVLVISGGSGRRSASETAALVLRGVLLGSCPSHLQPHRQALSSGG